MPTAEVLHGDCLDVLRTLPDGAFDAVVTDPPYALSFMGREWDGDLPGLPHWQAVLRVLKPGGYAFVFGGTRTFHRLACAMEDAGFELRDTVCWLYGQGFPKGKGCLKPAWEPITLARRPGPRVLPLGIDECRVGGPAYTQEEWNKKGSTGGGGSVRMGQAASEATKSAYRDGLIPAPAGRWPANVAHDASDCVMEAFAAFGEKTSGMLAKGHKVKGKGQHEGWDRLSHKNYVATRDYYGDTGTAARFFYAAKASRSERGEGNNHPTVKPVSLAKWLIRLACPAGGRVLDPFGGSGTTGVAAIQEGRSAVLIEREAEYVDIARRRIAEAQAAAPLFAQEG